MQGQRDQNSDIPYLQKLLNKDDAERNLILKFYALSSYLRLLYPVNCKCYELYPSTLENLPSLSINKLFFLVRDGLYRKPCVSVCVSVICVFSVFRIVNETSTEASLVSVIDQLYSTNSCSGALHVYSVQRLE